MRVCKYLNQRVRRIRKYNGKSFKGVSKRKKKNHTHVKKVWHISFWHLLVNLKNNYLLKKLLKWVDKKCKNFNIYNVAFSKNNKEKYLQYHYFTPMYQKS